MASVTIWPIVTHSSVPPELNSRLQEVIDKRCSHSPNDCARSCPYVQPPPTQPTTAEGSALSLWVLEAPPQAPHNITHREAHAPELTHRSPSPLAEDTSQDWHPLQESTESWADSCDREAASPPVTIPPTPLLPMVPSNPNHHTSASSIDPIAFTPTVVSATSIISSSTIATSSRAVPTELPLMDPIRVTSPQEEPPASVEPPLASPQQDPYNPRNDYNWVPTAPSSRLRPKAHDKPWTLFIGDSLLRPVNTSGVISGGQNNKQFQPHMQAVAWDVQDLAHCMPGYTQNPADGIGLDTIIISVGTNDVARLQKFGGIAPHVDLDHLVPLRVEQWEIQFRDMMEAAMACLDPYGTIFLIMPIGISSISSEDTGIAFFRDLITRLATNYPKLMWVDNANMICRNRAIPTMIKDADDPHFSERGKKQMVANLMAALRIAQADIASFAFMVNDHYIKVKRDPHRPSPKADVPPLIQGSKIKAPPRGAPPPSLEGTAPTPASSATSHASYTAAVSSQESSCGNGYYISYEPYLHYTFKSGGLHTMCPCDVFRKDPPDFCIYSVIHSCMGFAPIPVRETDPAPSAPSHPTDNDNNPGGSGASCPPTDNITRPGGSGAHPKTQSVTPQGSGGSGARPKTGASATTLHVTGDTPTTAPLRQQYRGLPRPPLPRVPRPPLSKELWGQLFGTTPSSTSDSVTITAELFQQLLGAAAAQNRGRPPHWRCLCLV